MSYFWLELRRDEPAAANLDEVYRDLAPATAQTHVIRVGTTETCSAALYVEPKAIPDVVIESPDGSWLLLIGTPLASFSSPAEEHRFLRAFLANPHAVARDGIKGNFAALAYDAVERRALVATDYTNTIPVFFAKHRGALYVASHELALARAVGAELDEFGVAQFLTFSATWDAWTRFRDISKLKACQVMTAAADERPGVSDYWVPGDETVSDAPFEVELERWVDAVTTKVREFFEASEASSVMSDFTAGEDARLVVAASHAAGLPLTAFVSGSDADLDVIVAKRAAKQAGFDLIHRERRPITGEQIEQHGLNIVAESDGYRDLFQSFTQFATDVADPIDPSVPKFSGIPGGEAFRGAYYLRGRALRPDAMKPLALPAFVRWKYLLDTAPGLVNFDDSDFVATVNDMTRRGIEQVRHLPIGTQIDHIIRAYQTVWWALKYRDPRYLPMCTGPLTRSMYTLRPRFKKGGRLTRASIEQMWPAVAFVRTQLGVPTVRRTWPRQHLFFPEYVSRTKKYARGINQRVLKLSPPKKLGYSFDLNADVLNTLLRTPPFNEWFASADAMVSGSAYRESALNAVLNESRAGTYKSLPTLQRILSNELAMRWVNRG